MRQLIGAAVLGLVFLLLMVVMVPVAVAFTLTDYFRDKWMGDL